MVRRRSGGRCPTTLATTALIRAGGPAADPADRRRRLGAGLAEVSW
ncbi:MAG: hypothetical protein ACFCVF_00685 [Kineosporiaceae bacterium]